VSIRPPPKCAATVPARKCCRSASKRDVLINAAEPVGHYGINLFFSDGHDTGIYSWEYLYDLGVNQAAMWDEYLKRMKAAGASRDPGISKMFEQRPKAK